MDTVAPSLTLPVDDTASQARRARDARRGLAVFFALLIPFSLFFEALMIISGNRGLWVVPLMLTPALTSVVTRLITRQGFADVSFRPGGRRGFQGILFALFFPIVICVVSYGIAWTMGLAPFTVSLQNPLTRMLAGLALSPVLNFLLQLLLMCTVGTLINSFVTAGEEIGWRGFMLTRLIDAGAPYPVLLSGFIW
ncbi:MAG TPA: hypothetical protein VKX46_13370, partial [Ktedonobacteraceae bacterium]|nr:hypothetical protein [Ktedonobacteraceae bacterium]